MDGWGRINGHCHQLVGQEDKNECISQTGTM